MFVVLIDVSDAVQVIVRGDWHWFTYVYLTHQVIPTGDIGVPQSGGVAQLVHDYLRQVVVFAGIIYGFSCVIGPQHIVAGNSILQLEEGLQKTPA